MCYRVSFFFYYRFSPCENTPPGFPSDCEFVEDFEPDLTIPFGIRGDLSGDFVRDTEADPKAYWESNNDCTVSIPYDPEAFGSCFCNDDLNDNTDCGEPENHMQDANGDPYNPPIGNLMTYNDEHCYVGFSAGQEERMHSVIESSSILQNCLFNNGIQTDVVISSSQTWSVSNGGAYKFINGNLIIESGATLTITSGVSVGFSQGKKVIVTPGATLILNGTLTGLGCGKVLSTWEGVEVWGTNSNNQQNGGQGRFIGRPGAVIEHADTGIKLYNPGGFSGGIATCTGVNFRNNRTGVDIAPYSSTSSTGNSPANYSAVFRSCSFIYDDDYISDSAFINHAKLAGVRGVRFLGCHFVNETKALKGVGILAFDAGFILKERCFDPLCNDFEKSSVKNMTLGIDASGALNTQRYIVQQTHFDNCLVGIWNQGVQNSRTLFNEFTMGDVTGGESSPSYQLGVVYESGINSLTCQENKFLGSGGNNEQLSIIGILSNNTGQVTKSIRRNSFNGLSYGNIANFDNGNPSSTIVRGLRYLCNTEKDLQKDYDVSGGSIRSKQRVERNNQGNIEFVATGNKFAYTGIDFESNDLNNIEYFFNPTGANEQPLNSSGDVTLSIGLPNTCNADFCFPNCDDSDDVVVLKSRFRSAKSSYRTIIEEIEEEPSEEESNALSYYQTVMDESLQVITEFYLSDTTDFHHDSLLLWIPNFNSFESQLWLANEYLGLENITTADQILAAIPMEFSLTSEEAADLNNYINVVSLLSSNDIFALDSLNLSSLKNYDNSGGHTQSLARSILKYYGAYYFPEIIFSGSEQERVRFDINPSPNSKSDILTIQPNPASDYVEFSLSKKLAGSSNVILIRDIVGRIVKRIQLEDHQNVSVWQTRNNQSGIYFYQFLSNGKPVQSGKILLNK